MDFLPAVAPFGIGTDTGGDNTWSGAGGAGVGPERRDWIKTAPGDIKKLLLKRILRRANVFAY